MEIKKIKDSIKTLIDQWDGTRTPSSYLTFPETLLRLTDNEQQIFNNLNYFLKIQNAEDMADIKIIIEKGFQALENSNNELNATLKEISKYMRAQTLIMASTKGLQQQDPTQTSQKENTSEQPTKANEQPKGKDGGKNATSHDKQTPNMNEIHFDISG